MSLFFKFYHWLFRLCKICGRKIPKSEPVYWYTEKGVCRSCRKILAHGANYGISPERLFTIIKEQSK